MYAIYRLQADKGTWYWAVHFSRKGKKHYCRFYDPKHGGEAPALAAAVAWRDAQLASTEALTVAEFCQHKRSNNSSGVPGVHFLRPPVQPLGIWQAKLKLSDGRSMSKSFSVSKYGADGAFKRAVAAREQMLASISDLLYLHDPLAKQVARMPAPIETSGTPRSD